ncbi:hypothetical protein K469DRAFT_505891, partial [Zopfia rhizophila CBS 207.26]
FISFLSLSSAYAIPSAILPLNLHSRQAPKLRAGSWLVTYKPSISSSTTYDGYFRVSSNSSSLFVSGDLYTRTTQPNPTDGIPILPRKSYWTFVRTTKLTPGSNGGFSLGLEYFCFENFTDSNNYTKWGPEPVDGGYSVDLSSASAPTGYPDPTNYFEGDVKFAGNSSVAGRLTMGWVNDYFHKFTLEIGSVRGLARPDMDSSRKYTWKSVFNDAGYDIIVEQGKNDIPEPSNPDLPTGMWTNEQEHSTMLQYRKPVDFDKEWRYFLLIVRLLQGVERGAMIDGGYDYNNLPREGTAVANDWIVGTKWDGSNETRVDWGPKKGEKFVNLHDAWFRACLHEVGHFFNLDHPTNFEQGIMTDSVSYAFAGNDGTTPEQFPDHIKEDSFKFTDYQKFLMAHLSDVHTRPGLTMFGAAAQ